MILFAIWKYVMAIQEDANMILIVSIPWFCLFILSCLLSWVFCVCLFPELSWQSIWGTDPWDTTTHRVARLAFLGSFQVGWPIKFFWPSLASSQVGLP